MGLKDIQEFSAEEVGLWVTAQGLDAPKFVEEGVDGDLLLSLTIEDLKSDLGLSGLQAKKVLKNIEFTKALTAGGEGGGEEADKLKGELEALTGEKQEVEAKVQELVGDKTTLEEKIQALEDAMKAKDDEIAELKHKMESMEVETKSAPAPQPAPAPKPAPAPAPSHAPKQHRQPGVIGGAARGAAGGAVKGAVVGAIVPGMDAGDGAKAGAAVGTLGGGVGAIRGRRRGRFGSHKGGAPAAAAKKPALAPPTTAKSKLRPNQISFNPNVPLSDRPVVALTTAVLANSIVDYELVSDHTRSGCALGLPSGNGEVSGDLAMARFIAKTEGGLSFLGGGGDEGAALMDQWVDYALSLSKFGLARRALAIQRTLDGILVSGTYVIGHSLTLADVALFASLGFPASDDARADIEAILPDGCPTLRWIHTVSYHPAIREAAQLAANVAKNDEARLEDGATMDPLVSGMGYLEGANPGCVATRFPPEPSGYLHVGHAKAVLLNDYYARRYGGRLIVRFDDTNPSKEKDEYQTSIVEDLGKIGVRPDVITFTSDYFETIKRYALWMINEGLAFMDDTPQEQMQKERMDRQHSKHRDAQSPAEALERFELMCSGKEEGKAWCLRARIDMGSDNGTLRDPVLYRQNATHAHHRSGTKYKAYPTYDLACPIVDSIEGVSHALRTTEYDDRNAQYSWIQKALGLRRVRIQTFARMNFMYTVMSKRKLTWFVDTGRVTGWDDPRFPTVRGVSRRGIDVGALKRFMCSQGASRRIVNMEWGKFWAENKKEIDVRAKRFMAIDKAEHVVLTVTNAGDGVEYVSTDYLPKDPSFGKRLVRIGRRVLLERVDTEGMEVGENIVLTRWGVVKLTKVEGGLEGAFDPAGDVKSAKRKLSWLTDAPGNHIPVVLSEFDNLISKEKLEEDDKFEDFINPDTQAETEVIGDAGLKTLKEDDIIQLERRGFYRVDRPYVNEGKPLMLFMIPDGRKKAMSGLDGKLAHR